MQTWTNIYDRVPSQYRQYVSYPTTTMKECPSKSEINSKLTHACTTDSNELAEYSSITLNFSEREELRQIRYPKIGYTIVLHREIFN